MTASRRHAPYPILNRTEVPDLVDHLLARPRRDRIQALLRLYPHDPQLRYEIETLLAAGEEELELLEQPPLGSEWLGIREHRSQKLGSYLLTDRLGGGEATEVYLAVPAGVEPSSMVKQVAIKTIRQDKLLVKEFRQRILFEAQWLQRINATGSSGIARCLSFKEEPQPYLVLEFIDGPEIDKYCRVKALGARERLCLFAQVCSAIHSTHRAKVLHLDVKPANILVTPAGEVKLIDFGAAECIGSGGQEVSPNVRFITPSSASPEQLERKPIDQRSDIYALGVLLYCLLSGSHPYVPREPALVTAQEVLQSCRRGEPRFLSTLIGYREFHTSWAEWAGPPVSNHRVSEGIKLRDLGKQLSKLDLVAARAVAYEPDQRYSSAEELRSEVDAISHQLD